VGCGLSAIPIGIDHGWITRAQGRSRVSTTLRTFYNGPQGTAALGTIGYKGFFYHFLNMNTATRFGTDVELSSIDTALLFAGMLDARQYFDSVSDTTEIAIRAMADSIYQRCDFNFMRNFNTGIMMGWKPSFGFFGYGQWIGYNEAMILYILALGSPTHPPTGTTVWTAWTTGYSFQLATAGLLVVSDQVTKLLVRRSLELYDSAVVIPNLVSFTRIHNTGAAFGLLDAADLPFKTALLVLVSVGALVGLLIFAVSLPEVHRLARVGVALVVGGADDNLIDRLWLGYVVDFMDVYWRGWHFWAFNVADSAITIGMALIILDQMGVGRRRVPGTV